MPPTAMPPPAIPRLKDVAEAANVSLSAASRILRGDRERFGEDTCNRVVEAARKLGWRRNLLVNGMQTGRTNTIGVMIPPYDSFWIGVLAGIHSTLANADFLPITVWVGDPQAFPSLEGDEDRGVAQISRLLDRRVDGLILWPPFGLAYNSHYRELIERRVPVAVIDHEVSEQRVADSIETDEEQGATSAAKHLLELGHRRIACLSTAETRWQPWAVRRRENFQSVVQSHKDTDFRHWNVGADPDEAIEIAKAMLTEWKPTAVFSVTDHEATSVYAAAAALGLSIPDDLSVLGFSDLDFARRLTPPLSTIRQRPAEIGQQAADLILARLAGRQTSEEPVTKRVGTDLIIRDSTARPRT